MEALTVSLLIKLDAWRKAGENRHVRVESLNSRAKWQIFIMDHDLNSGMFITPLNYAADWEQQLLVKAQGEFQHRASQMKKSGGVS